MRIATALALFAIFLFAGSAVAEIDATGSDPDIHHEFGTRAQIDCEMYFYGDPIGESGRFQGLGFTVTIGFDLTIGNLQNYDVLFIPGVGPGVIGGFQPDIEQFVNEGGGLWIHQPNGIGLIDYAPTGFDFFEVDIFWCDPFDFNVITDPGHPTMTGLSNADLSGRFDTVRLTSLGAGYTNVTAIGGGVCDTDMHSAAGEYGSGRVFADLSNLSPNSGDPGSDSYVTNVGDWLCTATPVPTDETTWGRLKSIYR